MIFNFGDSIYESLQRKDTPASLKEQIADFMSGILRFSGTSKATMETEETLWTLYALQEGVSRFTDTPEGVDRGNGTIRMIQFFTEVAGENQRW